MTRWQIAAVAGVTLLNAAGVVSAWRFRKTARRLVEVSRSYTAAAEDARRTAMKAWAEAAAETRHALELLTGTRH